MPFKPGESGNPQGRPAGAKGKVSEAIREKVESFLDSKTNDLDQMWKELDSKERANLLVKLLDFILPKLKSTDTEINVSKLTESELNTLVTRLIENLK